MHKAIRVVVLPHLSEGGTKRSLSALKGAGKRTELLGLRFVRCSRTKNWVGGFVQAAIERKKWLMLDAVTIVYNGGERVQELFYTLEGFLGMFELVEREGEDTRSELVWDDGDYPARLTSALVS